MKEGPDAPTEGARVGNMEGQELPSTCEEQVEASGVMGKRHMEASRKRQGVGLPVPK